MKGLTMAQGPHLGASLVPQTPQDTKISAADNQQLVTFQVRIINLKKYSRRHITLLFVSRAPTMKEIIWPCTDYHLLQPLTKGQAPTSRPISNQWANWKPCCRRKLNLLTESICIKSIGEIFGITL